MNFKILKSKGLWLDSLSITVALIAAVETVSAVCDFGIKDFVAVTVWWEKLLVITVTFILTWIIIAFVKCIRYSSSVSFSLHNIPVNIKEGDIFTFEGWKVIPFNEFFDTQVDDIVIAHNTLNGIFIDKYVEDIDILNNAITNASKVKSLSARPVNGKIRHQLGRIIPFNNDYLLLALSHFEDNQATLTHSQYESCLRTMWHEISRTYANRPVAIPLIGGGITRFENPSIKTEQQLLRCILCTLKTANVAINQPITILLTKDSIKKSNLYELKKQFG